jgi:hypothetical protein
MVATAENFNAGLEGKLMCVFFRNLIELKTVHEYRNH